MEPEFLELLSQTVRVREHVGRDAYGEESYSTTERMIPAHMQPRSESIATVAGETIWVAGHVYIPVTPGLDESDLYEVQRYDNPGEWEEIDVQSIQVRYDENGPHHMVLYYGVK